MKRNVKYTLLVCMLFCGILVIPGSIVDDDDNGNSEPLGTGGGNRSGMPHLEQFVPKEFKAGERILGLLILSVDNGEYRIENPFLIRLPVRLSVDGGATAVICQGAQTLETDILTAIRTDSIETIAEDLHGALFGAATQALGSFIGSPDIGYCAVHNENILFGPKWYQPPGDLAQYRTIRNTVCESGEGFEACEEAKCGGIASIERVWALRRAQRIMNDDIMYKFNIGLFLLYSHIIETAEPPENAVVINWYREHITASYGGILGTDDDLVSRTISQPEIDHQICLAGIDPGPGNPNPGLPNCSFNYGLGPVNVSVATDGSVTVSGGAGLIIDITFNPWTDEVKVGLSGGLQGSIGPYGVSSSAGIEINLQGGIDAFTDVAVDIGPVSCSFDQN